MYLNKVSNVIKVQRQLVNGLNYKVSNHYVVSSGTTPSLYV